MRHDLQLFTETYAMSEISAYSLIHQINNSTYNTRDSKMSLTTDGYHIAKTLHLDNQLHKFESNSERHSFTFPCGMSKMYTKEMMYC